MNKTMMVVACCVGILPGAAFAASENDNISGIQLCVDDASFTAEIGALGATSEAVAQGLYDYFVAQAAARKIKVQELGEKACTDYSVGMTFDATTGNPRAWLGALNVWDSTSFYAPNPKSTYKQPVSVWSSTYFGVLGSNDGLAKYLLSEGKSMIDAFFKAYLSVN